MLTQSSSQAKAPPSWPELAAPAFTAMCGEAARRCSTQDGLPVTLCDETRLRAWQLCWLAVDAASAPANNLPALADAQAWPPQLVEQLHATVPKLDAQRWQQLRHARDQGLFAQLPPQEAPGAQAIANEALASTLSDVFARLGQERLGTWFTPAATARITRWLSSCFLGIDALELSDDDSDAAALELILFVQHSLQRVHGAEINAGEEALHEPTPAAAASERPVLEAEPAAALVAQGASSPVAPEPEASNVAATPRMPEPASAREYSPGTAAGGDARAEAAPADARPRRRSPLRAAAPIVGVAAVGAALLLMLRTGDVDEVAGAPDATQPTTHDAVPAATAPEPPSHDAPAAQPSVAEPVPSAPVAEPGNMAEPDARQPPGKAATKRPRFRNLAAAKRAHTAKKLDDAAYAAAVAELEALRKAKIAEEQLALRRGKINKREYQRRVNAIDRSLGFDRR